MSHSTVQSTGNRGWRPEIEALVRALSEVLVSSRPVLREWSRAVRLNAAWDRIDRSGEVSPWRGPEINPGESIEALKLSRREAMKELPSHKRMYARVYEDLFWAIHRWREAIDHALEVLPLVARRTNDRREPEINRWTTRVRRELCDLAGFVHRDTLGDLPLLDGSVPPKFSECIEGIRDRLEELKAIESTDLLEAEASPPVAHSVESLNGSARADTSDPKPLKDGLDSEKAAAETPQPTASSPSENDKLPGRNPKRSPQFKTKPIYLKEAAEIFGMHKRTLRAAIDDGVFAVSWVSAKKLCLDLEEVKQIDPETAERLDPANLDG